MNVWLPRFWAPQQGRRSSAWTQTTQSSSSLKSRLIPGTKYAVFTLCDSSTFVKCSTLCIEYLEGCVSLPSVSLCFCLELGLPQAHATWSCWPSLKTSSIFSKLALLCGALPAFFCILFSIVLWQVGCWLLQRELDAANKMGINIGCLGNFADMVFWILKNNMGSVTCFLYHCCTRSWSGCGT